MKNSTKFWFSLLIVNLMVFVFIIPIIATIIILSIVLFFYFIISLVTYYDEYSDVGNFSRNKYNFINIIKSFNMYLDNLTDD